MTDTEKDEALSGVAIDPMVRRFAILRDATEKAIANAKNIKEDFDDAINWADLRCARVFYWVDDYGDGGFTVEIEEASPDAWELRRWIEEAIKNETEMPVEVITEW